VRGGCQCLSLIGLGHIEANPSSVHERSPSETSLPSEIKGSLTSSETKKKKPAPAVLGIIDKSARLAKIIVGSVRRLYFCSETSWRESDRRLAAHVSGVHVLRGEPNHRLGRREEGFRSHTSISISNGRGDLREDLGCIGRAARTRAEKKSGHFGTSGIFSTRSLSDRRKLSSGNLVMRERILSAIKVRRTREEESGRQTLARAPRGVNRPTLNFASRQWRQDRQLHPEIRSSVNYGIIALYL